MLAALKPSISSREALVSRISAINGSQQAATGPNHQHQHHHKHHRTSVAQMSQKRAPLKMEEPARWREMVENIRYVRKKYPAPVDSMGCDQAHANSDKSRDQRFQVLLSLMLSSQTKDPITWAAVQKLREAGLGNVQGLLGAREKDIEDLIHPVGFFRRKAVYLKEAARKIADEFGGEIPNSVEALCKLKGVGPKMAHLCMQEAWNVNSGIGVDTHVHRISGRLGWAPAAAKTPEQTREALESWMPRDYWREINHLLVGFGQTICTPLRPKCADCRNNEICPSSSIKSGKSGAGRQQKQKSGKAIKSEPEASVAAAAAAAVQPKREPEPAPEPVGRTLRTRSRRVKEEPKGELEEEEEEEVLRSAASAAAAMEAASKRIKLEKVELAQ